MLCYLFIYATIVFEKFRFSPSTRTHENGVLKKLHYWERFLKVAFSVTLFIGYMWAEGVAAKKKLRFQTETCCNSRPRLGVSVFVWKYNFLFADTPPVHTYPKKTVTENATIWKRSSGWRAISQKRRFRVSAWTVKTETFRTLLLQWLKFEREVCARCLSRPKTGTECAKKKLQRK